MANADQISRTISLLAPLHRVWRGLTEADQFATWFGVEFEAQASFVVGAPIVGRVAPTKVHPGIARTQKPYFGMPLVFGIERIEAMHLFSFRWHPFAFEKGVDYSDEATTLVVFELNEVGSRTDLTITESGFERIPPERRDVAVAANSKAWERQAFLFEKFLAGARDLRPIKD